METTSKESMISYITEKMSDKTIRMGCVISVKEPTTKYTKTGVKGGLYYCAYDSYFDGEKSHLGSDLFVRFSGAYWGKDDYYSGLVKIDVKGLSELGLIGIIGCPVTINAVLNYVDKNNPSNLWGNNILNGETIVRNWNLDKEYLFEQNIECVKFIYSLIA